MKKIILGVNHQFMYPDAISNEKVHTETLKKVASREDIDAIDCWIWRGAERSDEERKILLSSGKVINYNIGDRFGEDICLPSSTNETDRIRAYDIMMREFEYGLSVNTKKFVLGSGPDMPQDHEGAKERFGELITKVIKQLPKDVMMSLEPTDWDIDKHFLFGPMNEAVDFVKNIRKEGFENIGVMIDMCHVPIMHETLDTALQKAKDVLVHIHLGNCVIKDKTNEFYGDKHVAWNYPGGEYTEGDGVEFLKMLQTAGYFDKDGATVSFEMRPTLGKTAEESLERWVKIFKSAFN